MLFPFECVSVCPAGVSACYHCVPGLSSHWWGSGNFYSRTERSKREVKPFQPLNPPSFVPTRHQVSLFFCFFFSRSPPLCAPCLPSSSAPFFSLSVRFNELLCCHDRSVFFQSPCCFFLSPLSFFLLSFRYPKHPPPPPIGLSFSCRILGPLCRQYYLVCAYLIHFSRDFFGSLASSYLFKGTHCTACDI